MTSRDFRRARRPGESDSGTDLMRDAVQPARRAGSLRVVPERAPETPHSAPAPVRVVIEGVTPEIDGGRFPAKRVVGERVTIGADVFVEGHDRLAVALRFRRSSDDTWSEVPMELGENDRWEATFTVTEVGTWEYVVHAWVD